MQYDVLCIVTKTYRPNPDVVYIEQNVLSAWVLLC